LAESWLAKRRQSVTHLCAEASNATFWVNVDSKVIPSNIGNACSGTSSRYTTVSLSPAWRNKNTSATPVVVDSMIFRIESAMKPVKTSV